ncbi:MULTISPECIES: pyrroloquinoline quinone precursor peptide PqqA [Actinomadura]|jgi:coenzyme PQQ precursor peptide PqqA|uniref:Coenzyme PQQ synthesis protein A n=1 Tax=Actinomadura madurae TaxID=1993 RepID=A0A1I5A4Q0_9ACTN|nr:pyrroloquinoline quinone precursor peptide PqqA [Actinomadura madurae]SFN57434.1 coenzyme PQQ precursor peptide PqqA [Actinomadura madurae]
MAASQEQATHWVKPDYEIIETSLEVTAYYRAED